MNSATSESKPISKNRQYIDLQIERVKSFLEFLGSPQESYKSVIIGGTNGKGSTTHYLSLLTEKYTSLKTGRFISPHLVSPKERILINGSMVSDEIFQSALNYIEFKAKGFEKDNKHKLTEFEIYAAMAFHLFKEMDIDIAFLEVGMGGRLDATNIVSSKNTICSIITNISLDHMHFLGDKVEKIAYEKAGIIKESNILITQASSTALKVLEDSARLKQCEIIKVDTPTTLSFKEKNINLCLKSWEVIKEKLEISTEDTDSKEYLESINLPGRFHHITEKDILIDGGHNPAAAIELKNSIELNLKNKSIIYIIGMLNKDYKGFLNNLGISNKMFICIEPNSHRRTKKEDLQKYISENGGQAYTAENLKTAISMSNKYNKDITAIIGSLYLAGEAYELLNISPVPSHNSK